MKLPRIFRRNRSGRVHYNTDGERYVVSKHQQEINELNNMLTSLIERYKNQIKIQHTHTIKRNIPKPARIIVWAETMHGQRYNMGWIDMTYKYGAPLLLNVGMLGEPFMTCPPIQLFMEAQYDQRDD